MNDDVKNNNESDQIFKFDLENAVYTNNLIYFTSTYFASSGPQVLIETYDQSNIYNGAISTEGVSGSKKGNIKFTVNSPGSIMVYPSSGIEYPIESNTAVSNEVGFQVVTVEKKYFSGTDASNLVYSGTGGGNIGNNVESAIDSLASKSGYTIPFGSYPFNPTNTTYFVGAFPGLAPFTSSFATRGLRVLRSGRVNDLNIIWNRSSSPTPVGGFVTLYISHYDTSISSSNSEKAIIWPDGFSGGSLINGSATESLYYTAPTASFNSFFVDVGDVLAIKLVFTGYTTLPQSLSFGGYIFIDTSYNS